MKRLVSTLLGVLLVTACSTGQNAGGSANSGGGEKAGGATTSANIPKDKPTRIVAMSTETADMALLLTGADNMAAINAGSTNPAMGTMVEEARKVKDTLPPGVNPDAEQILSFKPDLVITTARHGGEKSANEQLSAAGVPMVEFAPEEFSTPESYAEALIRLGVAVHEQDKAETKATELTDAIAEIDSDLGVSPAEGEGEGEGETTSATYVSLMARGQKIMAMDDTQMMPGLAARAGGRNAAAAIGINQTAPIDAEKLVQAAPEVLLLEDFMGKGKQPFEAMLANPAVASIPAVKNGRVYVIEMTEASSLAGMNLPEGYKKVAQAVRGE